MLYDIISILKEDFDVQLWLYTSRKRNEIYKICKSKSLKMVFLIHKHHNIQGFTKEILKLATILENGGRILQIWFHIF